MKPISAFLNRVICGDCVGVMDEEWSWDYWCDSHDLHISGTTELTEDE